MFTSNSKSTAHSEAPGEPSGLVMHVFVASAEAQEQDLRRAVRSAINAAADLPGGTPIELAIQGPAVALLASDSPIAGVLADAAGRGITIIACNNSLRSANLEAHQLATHVIVVEAAIGHLTRRQWQGWAYVRV